MFDNLDDFSTKFTGIFGVFLAWTVMSLAVIPECAWPLVPPEVSPASFEDVVALLLTCALGNVLVRMAACWRELLVAPESFCN